MFTGARKKREMDWQLVASYFTAKSTDTFCSVAITAILSYCHTNASGVRRALCVVRRSSTTENNLFKHLLP